MYENSVTYQFIANVASALSTGDEITTLPEGSVGVFSPSGLALNPAAAATGEVLVAARHNGSLIKSPVFTVGELNHIEEIAYAAPTQQVTVVGGTASLDIDTNVTYVLSVVLDHTQGLYNNTPMIKTVPFYLSHIEGETAADTRIRLANGLRDAFNKQFTRFPGPVVVATAAAGVLTLTGQARSFTDPVTSVPSVVRFQVNFVKVLNAAAKQAGESDATVATIENTTEAFIGTGTGPQVAYEEVYTTMNEGNAVVSHYPPTQYRRAAILADSYDTITMMGKNDKYTVAATGQKPVSLFNLKVNLNTDLANAAANAILVPLGFDARTP